MKHGRRARATPPVVACLLVLTAAAAARCHSDAGPNVVRPRTTLRVGIGGLPSVNAERGVRQFAANIATEGLLRVNQEGRVDPWLAEGWQRSDDGLTVTVTLRSGVHFHDGSPVDPQAVVQILKEGLPKALGSAFEDVESIAAEGERNVIVRFRRASSFVADSLMDVPMQRPGTPPIGTGAFIQNQVKAQAVGDGTTEMAAFEAYYLGPPTIDKIAIRTYPNVRAAWADMLRQQLDMLYEVGVDAIDTMRSATDFSVYTFDRPYQYLVFLNPHNPKLKDPAIRRALNEAIDRAAVVREGLGGHGVPSAGPVSAHHWAFSGARQTFRYEPQAAAAKLGKRLVLRCVTVAEPPFEQIALVVKQQLNAVNVDLQVEAVPIERVLSTLSNSQFDTVLVESLSGWSVMRAYRWWHSKGPANLMRFSSPKVDATLDRIRYAVNDTEYRAAVSAFQQAIADDPPAIFLAWSERSRAISKRFEVQPEPGRDVLSTLRSWHLSTDKTNATRN